MRTALEEVMSVLDRIKQNEAELEKRHFGSGEESPSEEPEVPSPDDEEFDGDFEDNEGEVETSDLEYHDEASEEIPRPEEGEDLTQSDNQKKQQRVSWKKRYSTFKAKTDSTIYNLRKDLAETKNELADAYDNVNSYKSELSKLRQQLSQNKDPFEGLISDEDKDLLGEEAINVIKKLASKKEVDPRVEELQKRLEKYEKDRVNALRKEQDNFKVESQQALRTRLLNVVPNLDEVDYDPEFHEYLNDIDEDSGILRKNLFANAVTSRDVKNVARFYLDFRALRPKTKEEFLSTKVTPTGSGASSSSDKGTSKKRMIPYKEYSEYMSAVGRGKYKGDEKTKSKMDAMYDRAIAERRIIF